MCLDWWNYIPLLTERVFRNVGCYKRFAPPEQRPRCGKDFSAKASSALGCCWAGKLKLELACPKSHFGAIASAMPPDMRRGYAAPFKLDLGVGCALRSGFAPLFIGQRPNQGRSPNPKRNFLT